MRRKNLELPGAAQARLETIAELAVRMRETVRRLSEEWHAQPVDAENGPVEAGVPQRVA